MNLSIELCCSTRVHLHPVKNIPISVFMDTNTDIKFDEATSDGAITSCQILFELMILVGHTVLIKPK